MRLCPNIEIRVYPVINKFFGESITVSGLLTGIDIYNCLLDKPKADELIIPSCAVRREEQDFLCGMTVKELSERLNTKIRLCENDGFDFVDAVLGR